MLSAVSKEEKPPSTKYPIICWRHRWNHPEKLSSYRLNQWYPLCRTVSENAIFKVSFRFYPNYSLFICSVDGRHFCFRYFSFLWEGLNRFLLFWRLFRSLPSRKPSFLCNAAYMSYCPQLSRGLFLPCSAFPCNPFAMPTPSPLWRIPFLTGLVSSRV